MKKTASYVVVVVVAVVAAVNALIEIVMTCLEIVVAEVASQEMANQETKKKR